MRQGVVQEFILPWPPSVNTYWRSIVIKGQVRVLISREGREYRNIVRGCVIEQRVRRVGCAPISLAILASPPDERRRDLDNLPKAILDSLQKAGTYEDDFQIQRLTIVRCAVRKGGSIVISLVNHPMPEQTDLRLEATA